MREAVRFHLDAAACARGYDPTAAGIDRDLRYRLGPIEPVLLRLDSQLRQTPQLTVDEFDDLVAFLAEGLLDRRAERHLCEILPGAVPSGFPVMKFEACGAPR